MTTAPKIINKIGAGRVQRRFVSKSDFSSDPFSANNNRSNWRPKNQRWVLSISEYTWTQCGRQCQSALLAEIFFVELLKSVQLLWTRCYAVEYEYRKP